MTGTTEEKPFDRRIRMLRQLNLTCMACTMCELGRKDAIKGDIVRDPHVFSNMNPKRIVVVGQNPGWEELKLRQPFVGQSGKNFDDELLKNGLSRDDLYITNTVRCFITDNAKPSGLHNARCKPFLLMEMALIRPMLVATLGSVAYYAMRTPGNFQESLGTICYSEEYDVYVYPLYHPSPLNLADPGRRQAFNHQMVIFCKLVKKLQKAGDHSAL